MKTREMIKGENDAQMWRLCENVRKLRMFYGLSKREMAKIMHIGAETLRKIENGIIPDRFMFTSVLRLYYEFKITPHNMLTRDISEILKGKVGKGKK